MATITDENERGGPGRTAGPRHRRSRYCPPRCLPDSHQDVDGIGDAVEDGAIMHGRGGHRLANSYSDRGAIISASWTTVGPSKKLRSGITISNRERRRETSCVASSESPPRSVKKSSTMPTG